MNDDLESKVLCLNQWIKPTYYFENNGRGDCRVCQSHEDNKHCKGYIPVRVHRIIVGDDYNGESNTERNQEE